MISIDISKLVLWTENPRDPIDADAKDQDIVNRALEDNALKWTLPKLAKEMGDYFDFSELPTVVYHGDRPVVYDGNRRIILGKIKHGLVTIPKGTTLNIPDFPKDIPCNVCIEKIALNNVLRKHSDSGSWQPLERDVFLHKFMGREKTAFLILEEDTGIISANKHLNQRFVKEEIFKEDALKSMGFVISNGHLHSVHADNEGQSILSDISRKIKSDTISTRKNRGKVLEVLDLASQQLIEQNKSKKAHLSKFKFSLEPKMTGSRLTKRTDARPAELFGGKLYLKIGDVSNLYRDICDLYSFYISKKNELSQSFPSLIRMSLRLLCETASKDKRKKLEDYIKEYADNAKSKLDQDLKTTLANQNVRPESLLQLLQTGAHNYQSSASMDQTIAMSVLIGSILTVTHGKDE